MTLPARLESSLLTFSRLRRWLVAGFGLFVAIKGLLYRDWLSLTLGAAIVAYGMLAPT